MRAPGLATLQGLVFALVAAAFTNIYLPQPVLPVLVSEFGVSPGGASLTISMTILGIVLSNLPFGTLGDRYPIRPIVIAGGSAVVAAGLVCALTDDFRVLIAARLVQGLFMPALTTCVAAYLANSLPAERLNVIMGSYISATVVGGLGGRLLGGFMHHWLNWRYAFVAASCLLLLAVAAAALQLSGAPGRPGRPTADLSYLQLLGAWQYLRVYAVGFGAFWVFSSAFNYLPFYLGGPPFHAPTGVITLLYLAYLVGALVAPIAGKLCDRMGHGTAMALGAVILGAALAGTLVPSLVAVVVGLGGICAGFFTTHAAAIAALNSRLQTSRGRANALYVLSYYAGGYVGITVSGYVYRYGGWPAVVGTAVMVLLLPVGTGLTEIILGSQSREEGPARGVSGREGARGR